MIDKRVLFVGSSTKCDEDSCAFWMTGNKSDYTNIGKYLKLERLLSSYLNWAVVGAVRREEEKQVLETYTTKK